MKMIDITATIYKGMPVYGNKVEKQPNFIRNTNGYITETRLEIDVHSGTHIDAPLHMINEGDTFEAISMDKLVGQAKVLDLTAIEEGISKSDLEKFSIEKDDFILFKTRKFWCLTPEQKIVNDEGCHH